MTGSAFACALAAVGKHSSEMQKQRATQTRFVLLSNAIAIYQEPSCLLGPTRTPASDCNLSEPHVARRFLGSCPGAAHVWSFSERRRIRLRLSFHGGKA